jgi:branched-chain amino acid transport system permease protein
VEFDLALQTAANAGILTCIYALVAVGLAIVFGVMNMANMAHGEFYMVGAYCVWLLYAVAGWPFPAAVIGGMAIVAGLGLVVERAIFRPLRGQVVVGYIATAGLMFMMQVGVGRIWGVGRPEIVPTYFVGSVEFLGTVVGAQRLLVVPAAVAALLLLWFFLSRVKAGQALRAVAQDREAAALQGININRMTALAMGIGGAFAGLAGGLMAPVYPVTPYMGHAVILIAFIIIIVGGLGSIMGAIIASVIFGFLYTFVTTALDGVLASIIGVIVMLVVLAIRPKGLLGRVKA